MIAMYDRSPAPERSQVGGKGRALMECAGAGLPVPEFLVLTVKFFSPWMKLIRETPAFAAAAADPTPEHCETLCALARTMTLPPDRKKALEEAMDRLPGEIFAVRSSSPEEDLEGTSFAGMYETCLGVKREALEAAVARAFASCFGVRVLSYKRSRGLDPADASIAVVIQRQIASRVSGVGFSINPITNCYDEVQINAAFGLGESVVSGQVTPDTYLYDWGKKAVTGRKTGKKTFALWLEEQGGTVQHPPEDPDAEVLTDGEIAALAELIKKCESFYGHPVDTEWAMEGDRLYLLQARPVTAWFPLFPELRTGPGTPRRFYLDLLMMTQGFSAPMSVLGLDIWAEMLYFLKFNMLSPQPGGTAPALYGRQYVSLTAVSKAFGRSGIEKLLSQYDGNVRRIYEQLDLAAHPFPGTPEGLKGSKKAALRGVCRMLPNVIRAVTSDHKKVLAEYLRDCHEVEQAAMALDPEPDFEATASDMMHLMGRIMGTASVLIAAMMAQMQVKKLFKGMGLEDEITAMGMDLEGNPTSEMGRLLYEMAGTEEFRSLPDRETFVRRAEEGTFGPELMALYREFLEKYSVRGFMEIDVAAPRMYEDVGTIYDRLIGIDVEDNQITRVAVRRQAAYDRLLAAARAHGFEKKFRSCAQKYKDLFGYREHPKYLYVRLAARLHDLALQVADRWVREDRLDDRRDIFSLHAAEIARGQREPDFDLRAACAENLRGYAPLRQIREFPLVIDSRGTIYRPGLERREGDYVGDPIAPGRAAGRVKLLRSPYEKPLLAGEILVARATEPSWTPIFTNAAGVIMEIGGPLQHGGIIAREYGIPCVSGLIGIMEELQDGDLVEVDGSHGVVRRLSEQQQ